MHICLFSIFCNEGFILPLANVCLHIFYHATPGIIHLDMCVVQDTAPLFFFGGEVFSSFYTASLFFLSSSCILENDLHNAPNSKLGVHNIPLAMEGLPIRFLWASNFGINLGGLCTLFPFFLANVSLTTHPKSHPTSINRLVQRSLKGRLHFSPVNGRRGCSSAVFSSQIKYGVC